MLRVTTAGLQILVFLLLSAFAPASVNAGVKRAAKPPTALKIPKSKPPVYKAPKRAGNKKWRPSEPRKESDFKRSKAARNEFQRANPCPSTGRTTGKCPGYVVDHIRPLKRGGPDIPQNMQWQTKEAAKFKDQVE